MQTKLRWILLITMLLFSTNSEAVRFSSTYPCNDVSRVCSSSGTRVIDGDAVHRDCWEWSYSKICNYPSQNNCAAYGHCYLVANLECLLLDSYGNCVNQKNEFSCKRWIPNNIESQKVRVGLEEKDGVEGLVCKGIPCIDGNCVDKSYQTNGEMMDSISKLYAVSQAKGANDPNFKLFEGTGAHCSKKASGYNNCCHTDVKGWGKNIGAGCSESERQLMESRRKKLAVYVGKENKQTMRVTTVVKHHYCTFGNMLFKVIQVEGRKQLGLNFGRGGSPDCRGLTLAEIMRLDFDKMDFSEFIEDFKVKFAGKYKAPNTADIAGRIKGSIPNLRKYDDNPNNTQNNLTGWSQALADDSFEGDEERRAKAEKEEQVRLAKERADRMERERLAAIKAKEEQQRAVAREVEAKKQRRLVKEAELAALNLRIGAHYNKYISLYPAMIDAVVKARVLPVSGRLGLKKGLLALDSDRVLYTKEQVKAMCNHIPEYRACLYESDEEDRLTVESNRLTMQIKNGDY
jgi:hypothetical protein